MIFQTTRLYDSDKYNKALARVRQRGYVEEKLKLLKAHPIRQRGYVQEKLKLSKAHPITKKYKDLLRTSTQYSKAARNRDRGNYSLGSNLPLLRSTNM